MEGPTFAINSAVWIASDKDAFVDGKVVSQTGDEVVVQLGSGKTATKVTVKASECFAKEDDSKGVDDMTKLAYLHEPGVLSNLQRRYQLNQIYTYTGNILIAVNPFMRIPGLYDPVMKSQYLGARLGDLSPHVFAIADTAYRAMRADQTSQSILISGESGAGKTETTKLVMEYLAGVGGRTSGSDRSVEQQVLESNPILEAFGNAKTVRNNNSSRFGKFIEIQFDEKGRVSGAAIKSYLLEKSRVVQIKDPERNYHCFYQLCSGASPEEVARYKLPTKKAGEYFRYLKQSKSFEIPGATNAEEYKNTRRAMNVLGFSAEEQETVFRIVAAILHLGNIEFVMSGGIGDPLKIPAGASTDHLRYVAELLKCDLAKLEESLCTITRKVAGETLRSPLDPKEAASRRDSFSKNLYSTLFDWIVQKINDSIGVDENAEVSIGVLDIYGFEHFEYNSFEQFCINLANEKLQQHFNQHVLKMEQEEYEREEIQWSRIPFADNQDCLDLVEKERGIISFLDSACKMKTTTPESFTRTLYKECGTHRRFSKASNFSKVDFTLEHYAGKVTYNTEEFLVKNVDAVVPEHHELLSKSADPFLQMLFPAEAIASKQNKFVSLGNSFKLQLGELMTKLNTTEPHYIRCVKPNSKLKPQIFEKPLAMTQLRSGGVLEAVRMCSAGYPTRRTFDVFLDRFGLLAPMDLDYETMSEKENCEVLMKKTGLENYQIGLTKVFLRAGQMVLLETKRLNKMNAAAQTIQRSMRRFLFTHRRRKMAVVLQALLRARLARHHYVNVRKFLAATMVQRYVRGRQKRMEYVLLRDTAIFCQALVRGWQTRKRVAVLRRIRSALIIQSALRAMWTRRRMANLRRFTVGRVWRKRLARLKANAARQSDLQFQLDETTRKANEAAEAAERSALRITMEQRMREKAEKKKESAEAALMSAQKEADELRAQVAKMEAEMMRMQYALQDALQQAQEEAAKAAFSTEAALEARAAMEAMAVTTKAAQAEAAAALKEAQEATAKAAALEAAKASDPVEAPMPPLLAAPHPPSPRSRPSPSPQPTPTETPPPVAETLAMPPGPPPKTAMPPIPVSLPPAPPVTAEPPPVASLPTTPVPAPEPPKETKAETLGEAPSFSLQSVTEQSPPRVPDVVSAAPPVAATPASPTPASPLPAPQVTLPFTDDSVTLDPHPFAAIAPSNLAIPPLNLSAPRAGGLPTATTPVTTPHSVRGRRGSMSAFPSSATVAGTSVSGPPLGRRASILNRTVSSLRSSPAGSPVTGSHAGHQPPSPRAGVEADALIIQKLRQENAALKDLLKATEDKFEASREETLAQLAIVTEVASAKEAELKEVETQLLNAQEKLSSKERLEQDNKILRNHILFLTAQNRPELPPDKQLDLLLEVVGGPEPLGYSTEGHPVVATVVYKTLVQWQTFEQERTNTFDRITETFQQAARGNASVLAYWLTNTTYLFFLVQEVYQPKPKEVEQAGFNIFFMQAAKKVEPVAEESLDTVMFKLQLSVGIERLYVTIRDDVKAELLPLLSGQAAVGNKPGGSKAAIPRQQTVSARKSVNNYWAGILTILKTTVATLQENYVPPFLVYHLLKQLLQFVDCKIFTGLMVRFQWCLCTHSNGELMDAGLAKLLDWLEGGEDSVQHWLGDSLNQNIPPLYSELRHVEEAVKFLLDSHKPLLDIDELKQMCPHLSMNQLVHMCMWYEDDKYMTPGPSQDLIQNIWSLIVEDSPLLLGDDESLPFRANDVIATLHKFDLDEVQPPPELLTDRSFLFLLPKEDESAIGSTRSMSMGSMRR